jgi:hypothetical protein
MPDEKFICDAVRTEENFIMKTFKVCTIHQILVGNSSHNYRLVQLIGVAEYLAYSILNVSVRRETSGNNIKNYFCCIKHV